MKNSHKSLRKIQIEKWAKDLNRPFMKKGSPHGQYMYEKMLSFISYQGNASQNRHAAPLPNPSEALWQGQPAWAGERWCSSRWAEGLSLTASGMSVSCPLWKTAWHHLLKLQVSYDPEVPFFSRYVPNRNGYLCAPKNMFRNLLPAPLHKIAPTGNRPNLHWLDEHIVVHAYSIIVQQPEWMNCSCVQQLVCVSQTLSQKSQTKKDLLYDSSQKYAKLGFFQDVYPWRGSNWTGKTAVSRVWVLVGKIVRWPPRVPFSDIHTTYTPLPLNVSGTCEYDGLLLSGVSYVILQR